MAHVNGRRIWQFLLGGAGAVIMAMAGFMVSTHYQADLDQEERIRVLESGCRDELMIVDALLRIAESTDLGSRDFANLESLYERLNGRCGVPE